MTKQKWQVSHEWDSPSFVRNIKKELMAEIWEFQRIGPKKNTMKQITLAPAAAAPAAAAAIADELNVKDTSMSNDRYISDYDLYRL